MNAMAKVLGADPKRRFYDKIAEEESKATDSEEETKAPEGGFEGPHPPTEGECAGGNSQGPRSMGTQAMRVKPRRIIDTAHAPGTPSSHAEAMRKWIHSRAGQAAQRRLAAPAQPAPVVVAKLALMSPRAGDSPSPEEHEHHMAILNMFNRIHGGYDTLGGKRDPQDRNLLSALLREICEELGCRTAAGDPDVTKLKATYEWIDRLQLWHEPTDINVFETATGDMTVYRVYYFWATCSQQQAKQVTRKVLAEEKIYDHKPRPVEHFLADLAQRQWNPAGATPTAVTRRGQIHTLRWIARVAAQEAAWTAADAHTSSRAYESDHRRSGRYTPTQESKHGQPPTLAAHKTKLASKIIDDHQPRHHRAVPLSKRVCDLLNKDLASPGVQLWDIFPRADMYSAIGVVAGTKKGPKREVEILRVMVT